MKIFIIELFTDILSIYHYKLLIREHNYNRWSVCIYVCTNSLYIRIYSSRNLSANILDECIPKLRDKLVDPLEEASRPRCRQSPVHCICKCSEFLFPRLQITTCNEALCSASVWLGVRAHPLEWEARVGCRVTWHIDTLGNTHLIRVPLCESTRPSLPLRHTPHVVFPHCLCSICSGHCARWHACCCAM